MNKSIIALTVAALGLASAAKAVEDISISATFGYESEYVFRGEKFDQQVFQPAIDLEYGNFYAGIWGSNGISAGRDRDATEINFYGGYAIALDETVSLDFGGTYYYFPEAPSGYTREIYVGAAFDVPFEPAGYIYYDFDLYTFTFELSAGHSIEVADSTSVDFSGYVGYQRFRKTDDKNGYYAGVSADLTYAFTDNASFSVGPRVSSRKVSGNNSNQNFWWGAAFTAGF